MAYPLPRDPWSNGPYGPSFDGRHAHNLTTNPYLNTIFEGVNRTQDMIEFAPIGGGGGYNPNLAFLDNFVNPILDRAGEQYRAGMDTANNQEEEGGGGFFGGIFRGIGDLAGGILKLPGQILAAPFNAIGLDFVGDILEAPGNIVGGLVEGVGDVVGGVVDAILPF